MDLQLVQNRNNMNKKCYSCDHTSTSFLLSEKGQVQSYNNYYTK